MDEYSNNVDNGTNYRPNTEYNTQYMHSPDGPEPEMPGKGTAIASMVLGIVSIVFCLIPLIGIATGVVGLVCSVSAKKSGNRSGFRTAGFVCSLIGLCFSGLVFISCMSMGTSFNHYF